MYIQLNGQLRLVAGQSVHDKLLPGRLGERISCNTWCRRMRPISYFHTWLFVLLMKEKTYSHLLITIPIRYWEKNGIRLWKDDASITKIHASTFTLAQISVQTACIFFFFFCLAHNSSVSIFRSMTHKTM